MLSRFCEPRDQLTIIFPSEESELAILLSDETRGNKADFLTDISHASNAPHESVQGRKENILTCTNKINSFKEKVTLCEAKIEIEKKGEVFEPIKSCTLDTNLVDLFLQSLSPLTKSTEIYFSSHGLGSVSAKCVRVSRIKCCRR